MGNASEMKTAKTIFDEVARRITEADCPKPQVEMTMKETVSITPGELFNDLVQLYSAEQDRVLRFKSTPNLMSGGEMMKYFHTLLWIRVQHVRGTLKRDYKKFIHKGTIPALVYQILLGIGDAKDADYGIRFTPQFEIETEMLLAPEQVLEISDKFDTLNLEGLVCIETGVPKDPEGELGFMATYNMEGKVLSYRKDHPVYGFYSAFFEHQLTQELLKQFLRVSYGYADDYQTVLRSIFKGK